MCGDVGWDARTHLPHNHTRTFTQTHAHNTQTHKYTHIHTHTQRYKHTQLNVWGCGLGCTRASVLFKGLAHNKGLKEVRVYVCMCVLSFSLHSYVRAWHTIKASKRYVCKCVRVCARVCVRVFPLQSCVRAWHTLKTSKRSICKCVCVCVRVCGCKYVCCLFLFAVLFKGLAHYKDLKEVCM